MRKYLPELMSLIVDALLDGAVASKREVAVATLGQVVQSTGYLFILFPSNHNYACTSYSYFFFCFLFLLTYYIPLVSDVSLWYHFLELFIIIFHTARWLWFLLLRLYHHFCLADVWIILNLTLRSII